MSSFQVSKHSRTSGLEQASWSQGLLTLISIILGVAVAFGARRIFDLSTGPTGLHLPEMIHAFTVFMFITGTYYHMYTIVSFFFIIPGIVWVMLNTAVGIGAIMAALAIGNTKYFLVAAIVVYGFGVAVFANALIERYFGRIGLLAHDEIDAKHAYRVFASEMIKNTTCFIIMFAVSSGLYYAVYVQNIPVPMAPEFLFIMANGFIYSIMICLTEFRFLPAIRQIWELDTALHEVAE